jgi:cell division protein FtsL
VRPARALRPDVAPVPAPAERRHLRVVPAGYVSARTRRKRARLLVVLGGVAIAAALFGVVAFHVVLTQSQLDIQHLRAEADAASVKQQQLRLQVAQLESPERVVDAAQNLGMVPPATVHYLSPNGAAAAPKPTPTTTPKPSTANAPATTTPKLTKPAVTTAPSARTAVPKTSATPTPKLTGTPTPSASPSTTAVRRSP